MNIVTFVAAYDDDDDYQILIFLLRAPLSVSTQASKSRGVEKFSYFTWFLKTELVCQWASLFEYPLSDLARISSPKPVC